MAEPATAGAIRIGDAERDRAATALGEHLRAGRLLVAEYDERVQAAYGARTAADVTTLFTDLPGGSPLGPHPVVAPGRSPARRRYIPLRVLIVLLIVASFAVSTLLHWPVFLIFGLLWFGLPHRGLARRGRCRGW